MRSRAWHQVDIRLVPAAAAKPTAQAKLVTAPLAGITAADARESDLTSAVARPIGKADGWFVLCSPEEFPGIKADIDAAGGRWG